MAVPSNTPDKSLLVLGAELREDKGEGTILVLPKLPGSLPAPKEPLRQDLGGHSPGEPLDTGQEKGAQHGTGSQSHTG